jgi:hypothetical protein
MKQVAFFKATCSGCDRSFQWPLLSDFSYGEFILHGSNGTTHAYVSLFDNATFDVIRSVLPTATPQSIQEVLARVADQIDDQQFTTVVMCPHCNSHDLSFDDTLAVQIAEISIATFDQFLSLNESERRAMVMLRHSEVDSEN